MKESRSQGDGWRSEGWRGKGGREEGARHVTSSRRSTVIVVGRDALVTSSGGRWAAGVGDLCVLIDEE